VPARRQTLRVYNNWQGAPPRLGSVIVNGALPGCTRAACGLRVPPSAVSRPTLTDAVEGPHIAEGPTGNV
jgi:hypothetical protein